MVTWKSRIEDLQALGMTRQEIAEHAALTVSTVSDILNGWSKEPRGDAAVKLHELHKTRCSQPQESMPSRA